VSVQLTGLGGGTGEGDVRALLCVEVGTGWTMVCVVQALGDVAGVSWVAVTWAQF
jgi:hypothetical protein